MQYRTKDMHGIIRKAMKTSNQSYKRIVITNSGMIKAVLFLVAFILLKSSPMMAQGTLTGFVVDDEFNEPLEKAVITIPGTLISVLTDQQGKYTLKLRGGDYFMEVNFPG